MKLRLYNTLSRQKEDFVPRSAPNVGVYSCGPTVYDYLTIGNLRSFFFADVLRRVLEYNKYQVKHVINITDVGHLVGDGNEGEDKLEKGAKKLGKSAREVAEMFTEIYHQDLEKLNIKSPTVEPKATDHIDEQIEFIKELEKKGFTYKISDGVYFDTSKAKDYGELAHLSLEDLQEGARVEPNPEKKNSTDFALWKFHKGAGKREMEWNSPWGVGFPGWHIECSAMGTKYLGEHIDIHTSGIDHIPVHHTNERAQNIARFGHPVVSTWMHGEFISVDGKRIGKSEGNAITVSELETKGYDPLSYRYLLLQSHYRQQTNFTYEALEAAQTAYYKLIKLISQYLLSARKGGGPAAGADPAMTKQFEELINDDLNMPKALALAWDITKGNLPHPVKHATLINFDEVFGLKLAERAVKMLEENTDIPEELEQLKNERELARASGDWTLADQIRQKINNLGYFVEDTEDGPTLGKKL